MADLVPTPPPAVSLELVQTLDHIFPEKCIGVGEEPAEAHRRAGARGVVDYLKSMYLSQNPGFIWSKKLDVHRCQDPEGSDTSRRPASPSFARLA